MNYNFDSTRDYTKKEIAEFTGLSPNTVTESLKSAQFSTSDRVYKGAELLERFVPVRRMLDAGRTHDEIRDAYGMKNASSRDAGMPPSGAVLPEIANQGMESLESEIAAGMKEAIQSLVQAATEDIVEYIPGMVAASLAEAAQTGKIREAFHAKLREHFAKRRSLQFGPSAVETTALPVGDDDDDDEWLDDEDEADAS